MREKWRKSLRIKIHISMAMYALRITRVALIFPRVDKLSLLGKTQKIVGTTFNQ